MERVYSKDSVTMAKHFVLLFPFLTFFKKIVETNPKERVSI